MTKVKNAVQETVEKKSPRDVFRAGALVLLSIFVVPTMVAFGMSQFDTLDNMEAAYELTVKNIEAEHELFESKVEACKLQEQSMAKKKAEEFYAERLELSDEDLDRIQLKAEGKNLECGSFT